MAKKLMRSPRGLLVYPWLSGKPDTKYKKEGYWRTGLRLPTLDPEAIMLMNEIDAKIANAVKTAQDKVETPKAKKAVKPCEDKPYRIETDEDDDPTGNVVFNFKMQASGVNKKTGESFTRKPALFDAKGLPLPAGTKIGGGSEAKVSFEFYEFPPSGKTGAGVSLRLEGVQIIKLVEWGSNNIDYYGFENESEEEDSDEEASDGGKAEAAEESEEEEKTEF